MRITFDASDKVALAFGPVVLQKKLELKDGRYGTANVLDEFMNFIVDHHPEMIKEFAGQSRQSNMFDHRTPGVEYRDVADPEPEDRRGKHNGSKHAASK